jgi:hypothetical protein
MELETKGRNTLVRPYEETRFERKALIDLSSILVRYLTQSLTELNLEENRIGDIGAQYLGESLRTNTVREKDFH